MNRPGLRVLLVEDDPDDYLLAKDMLHECSNAKFDLVWVSTFDDASRQLELGGFDICILDYDIGERCGMELLEGPWAKKKEPPVIFLTGRNDFNIDCAAMKAGASQYLTKDHIDERLLERSIRYAIARRHTERELEERISHLEELLESRIEELVQAGKKLRETERAFERACCDLELLIQGRTAEPEPLSEPLQVRI